MAGDVFLYPPTGPDVRLRTADAPTLVSGSLAAALDDLAAVTATATTGHPGTVTAVMDGIAIAADGRAGHVGVVAVVLDDITAASAGLIEHAGVVALSLGDVTSSTAATAGRAGSIAAALDGITVAAAATAGHTGDFAVVLDSIQVVSGVNTLQVPLDGVLVFAQGTVIAASTEMQRIRLRAPSKRKREDEEALMLCM